MPDSRTFSFRSEGRVPIEISREIAAIVVDNVGKYFKLMIGEDVELSSNKQLKYYCTVIVSAYQDCYREEGKHYTKEDLHDAMMRTIGGFGLPYVNPFTGEPENRRISYGKLSMKQAEGYHTLCRQHAADRWKIEIPEPNEDIFERI